MALNCGIVGLPNVGKSTIFQALTSAPAQAANYPFCTIEPNLGIVNIPDKRLLKISNLIEPEKVVPATMEFVDIAGLVKGASKGEGLGNQFLGHIRQVGAMAHVVRCFVDDDVIHVHGEVDPIGDIETINIELALADLETVTKRHSNLSKMKKSQDKKISKKAMAVEPILQKLITTLEAGEPARNLNLMEDELELISDLHLITLKPTLYICNVDEDSLMKGGNEYVKRVQEHVEKEHAQVVSICGKVESEIAALETIEERREFLLDMGIEESGLEKLIRGAFKLLGLCTYFTAGKKEVRAWTYPTGFKAPQAAGIIHTDFERGFIKAEVYHCDELFDLGSEGRVKELGKLRVEGREYVVKDGDVIHFRFNV